MNFKTFDALGMGIGTSLEDFHDPLDQRSHLLIKKNVPLNSSEYLRRRSPAVLKMSLGPRKIHPDFQGTFQKGGQILVYHAQSPTLG